VWTDDRERCAAAYVPETVGFATKPRLAEKMIDRVLPEFPELPENTWLAADEVYGRDGAFRSFAESRQLPYVVNVSSAQTVLPRPGWRRIDKLAAASACARSSRACGRGPGHSAAVRASTKSQS